MPAPLRMSFAGMLPALRGSSFDETPPALRFFDETPLPFLFILPPDPPDIKKHAEHLPCVLLVNCFRVIAV